MRLAGLSLSFVILAAAAHADLKMTTRTSYQGHESSETIYEKGTVHWEDRNDAGQAVSITIVDKGKPQVCIVDVRMRRYSVYRPAFRGESYAKTQIDDIYIEEETRDTGERRNAFGHEARHLVTTERWDESRTRVTDGWYVYLPGRFDNPRARFVDSAGDRHPVLHVNHKGPEVRGIAMWEKEGDFVKEVTEFSEAPLDPKLFEVPAGFRRVIPEPYRELSLPDQISYQWERFENWLGLI